MRGKKAGTKTLWRLLKQAQVRLPFGAERLEGEVAVAALAMRRPEGIKNQTNFS